jgi:lipoprotein-anchoring transpeptidase ErfK/SrfK
VHLLRRAYLFLLIPLALGGPATAQAQQVRRTAYIQPQPQKSPGDLIQRQADPKITLRLMSTTGPENSRVYVSLSKQRAYLINTTTDEIVIDSPISSGKAGHTTPKGKYAIKEKDRDHRSSIYGDFVDSGGRTVRRGVSTKIDSAPSGTKYVGASMKWFMRLTNEGVGMHTGILPGYAASHGCIRMPEQIAQMFYDRIKVGTPAVVAD